MGDRVKYIGGLVGKSRMRIWFLGDNHARGNVPS
jgi:hypothetical protein